MSGKTQNKEKERTTYMHHCPLNRRLVHRFQTFYSLNTRQTFYITKGKDLWQSEDIDTYDTLTFHFFLNWILLFVVFSHMFKWYTWQALSGRETPNPRWAWCMAIRNETVYTVSVRVVSFRLDWNLGKYLIFLIFLFLQKPTMFLIDTIWNFALELYI